jgi:Calcineurin-like phosphoesterase
MRALVSGLVAVWTAGAALAGPAWVEMTASGPVARTITTEARCPSLLINGAPVAMVERAGPNAAFPDRVCQASLPRGAKRVSLAGKALALPKARPDRILIIGDTGCRLKKLINQNCNDPAAWPFPRIAALAAAQKPDLVVHVGDYYYRETPCPAGMTGCQGSPYGDKRATWDVELFKPAAPLLAVAPWVFTRGNHEDCDRGGAGWFRMLDAGWKPKTCPAGADSFRVPIGGAELLIVDSADTDDVSAPDGPTRNFTVALGNLSAGANPTRQWIVTHRPIWNATRIGSLLNDGVVNATERAAVKGKDLSGVDLVLAGHVHNFSSLDFVGARPAALVVGDGGDLMAPNDTPSPAMGVVKVDGLDATAYTIGRFGYLVLDRVPGGWKGALHDTTDKIIARCNLSGRSLRCSPA